MHEFKLTGDIKNVPSDTVVPIVDVIVYYYGSGRALVILEIVA